MSVLQSALDVAGEEYADHRRTMLERIAELDVELAKSVAGGGEKYIKRHRKRGKLLARERIELLLD
ncbi:MAG TPA: acyl-CoA carboxylase subunit beta, partial [Streptomyces sp.]|nr:acyl-CoA carboxylase subunit beta [Streptomyces sp.]